MNQINPKPEEKDEHRQSVLESIRQQKSEMRADIARRSWRVTLLKRILPGLAVLLLVALATAPSWRVGQDANRVTYHLSATKNNETSRMEDATYHGRDQQGQPYVISAASVVQQNANTVALTAPQGNITLKSGAWLMLKAATGTYHQKTDKLELSGGVTLYRNDGTVITTSSATIDLRAGEATGTMPVQISGSFGVLDAQNGFTLRNHGDQIMFEGPTKLLLNQAK